MHTERLCWVPFHLRKEGPELLVDWVEVAPDAFRDPFFDQTIYARAREHSCPRRTTSAAELQGESGSGRPAGLIFHMSRCGSTLVAQMLAGLRGSVVLSEPSVIDRVLRGNGSLKPDLLGNMVTALVAPFSTYASVVIKFSGRAVTEHEVIRETMPEVPGIFLYRDPVEALVSLVGQSHEQLPPGLAAAGLLAPDVPVNAMRPAEFWARVIARQCEAGLDAYEKGGGRIRLFNYQQLPEAVWKCVAGLFGFSISLSDRDRMREISGRRAKSPDRRFESDGLSKRRVATPEIEAAATQFVYAPYSALENARLKAVFPDTDGMA
jgi:hypothetical protein